MKAIQKRFQSWKTKQKVGGAATASLYDKLTRELANIQKVDRAFGVERDMWQLAFGKV